MVGEQDQGEVEADHNQAQPPGFLDDTRGGNRFSLTTAIEWRVFFLEEQDDSGPGTSLAWPIIAV